MWSLRTRPGLPGRLERWLTRRRRARCGSTPIIYAEVSVRFSSIEDLEDALPRDDYRRAQLPWEAAFLAGKAFLGYRRGGGTRPSTLPDLFIGAHAAVDGLALLTRDQTRYRTYFPTVELVTPNR